MSLHASSPITFGRLDLIDCYRAVAALLVVVYHATGCVADAKYFSVDPLGGLFACGGRGVDLFFVLSGFIITFVHWNEFGQSAGIPAYFVKRAIRIFPTLWCVGVPLVVAGIWLGTQTSVGSWGERTELVVGSLTLVPTRVLPIPVVVWTLRHEILFYLLFALVIWRPIAGTVLLSLWGGGCLFHATAGLGSNFLSDFFFSPYNLEFLMGIVCGWLLRRQRIPVPWAFVATGVALFAMVGLQHARSGPSPVMLAPWIASHTSLAEVLLFGGSSMLLILGLAELDRGRRLVPSGFMVSLGTASYSIYLIHYPVISITCKVLKLVDRSLPVSPSAALGLSVLASLIAGGLLHHFVERPLLAYSRSTFLPRVSPPVKHQPLVGQTGCRAA